MHHDFRKRNETHQVILSSHAKPDENADIRGKELFYNPYQHTPLFGQNDLQYDKSIVRTSPKLSETAVQSYTEPMERLACSLCKRPFLGMSSEEGYRSRATPFYMSEKNTPDASYFALLANMFK